MAREVASRGDVAWGDELWVGRMVGSTRVWTEILGVETVGMPEQAPEDVDFTHMKSPGRTRETRPGLLSSADFSQELQDWGPDETFLTLLDDLAALTEAGQPEDVHVEMVVGGRRRAYRSYVNRFTPAGTVGDKRMASVAFKVFNRVPEDRVPGGDVAPINTVPPHVLGNPIVGQTLTAWDGIWETEANLSYQWKADAVSIAGATGKTLLVSSAHVGNEITVTVTATNAAGATPVTSTATAEVA